MACCLEQSHSRTGHGMGGVSFLQARSIVDAHVEVSTPVSDRRISGMEITRRCGDAKRRGHFAQHHPTADVSSSSTQVCHHACGVPRACVRCVLLRRAPLLQGVLLRATTRPGPSRQCSSNQSSLRSASRRLEDPPSKRDDQNRRDAGGSAKGREGGLAAAPRGGAEGKRGWRGTREDPQP